MRRPALARPGAALSPLADASDPLALPEHHFPQLWLLFASLASLGLAVLVERNLVGPVFALDRSHVTALIAALVLAASVHACWHVVLYSRRIEAARHALGRRERAAGEALVSAWVRAALPEAASGGGAREELLERYADRLRSPVDLGWFLVDMTVRLGLLGTIIGFILIFGSLSSISIDGAEGLRDLLIAMSGGMGTALFTTLAGLIGATLLSVQYLILGREAEHLLGLLAQVRHVPPEARWQPTRGASEAMRARARYRPVVAGADPFTDLLFNVLLGFILLFFVAILFLAPAEESGKIDIEAEYVISVTWPDGTNDDIDTYIQDPVGNLTWFRNRSSGLVHLDRDDRGMLDDTLEVEGRTIVNPLNQEVAAVRGTVPGEYVVNVHYYDSDAETSVPVSVKVSRVNPVYTVAYYGTETLSAKDEERTVVRFSVRGDGSIGNVNRRPKSLVPR